MTLLERRRTLMLKKGEIVLPSGYTKLDYVSGATQKINTGISAEGTIWQIDVQAENNPSLETQVVIATDGVGGHFFGLINTSKKWGVGDSLYFSNAITDRSVIEIEFTTKGIKATLDGVTKSREGTSAHTYNVHLFANPANGYKYPQRLYGAKCLSGGSFHGIPCKRDSDDKQGLYDIENDTFYAIVS